MKEFINKYANDDIVTICVNIFIIFVTTVTIFGLPFAITSLCFRIFDDGRIIHCTIQQRDDRTAMLVGHRYKNDIVVAVGNDHNELLKLGKEIGCIDGKQQH